MCEATLLKNEKLCFFLFIKVFAFTSRSSRLNSKFPTIRYLSKYRAHGYANFFHVLIVVDRARFNWIAIFCSKAQKLGFGWFYFCTIWLNQQHHDNSKSNYSNNVTVRTNFKLWQRYEYETFLILTLSYHQLKMKKAWPLKRCRIFT